MMFYYGESPWEISWDPRILTFFLKEHLAGNLQQPHFGGSRHFREILLYSKFQFRVNLGSIRSKVWKTETWLGPGGWFHNPSLRGRFGGGVDFFFVFFFGPYSLVGSFDCVRFGMF